MKPTTRKSTRKCPDCGLKIRKNVDTHKQGQHHKDRVRRKR